MAYDSRTDRYTPSFEDRAKRKQRRTVSEPRRSNTRSARSASFRDFGMDDR